MLGRMIAQNLVFAVVLALLLFVPAQRLGWSHTPVWAQALGAPLLLGSLWGLLGIVLVFPLLAARALGEEVMSADESAAVRLPHSSVTHLLSGAGAPGERCSSSNVKVG